MRRVSPLLFQQHLSSRLPQACTHEDGRSIRNHTNSSLRNHHVGMARYRFYTRAKTLALRPLGVRVVSVLMVEGLSSAFLVKKTDSCPSSLPIIPFILLRYVSAGLFLQTYCIISLSPPPLPWAMLSFRLSRSPPNVHFGSTPVIIAVTFAFPLYSSFILAPHITFASGSNS